jgi:hypothetical protein
MEYLRWLGRFYGVAFAGNTLRAALGCAVIGLAFGGILFVVSRTSYLNLLEAAPPSVTVRGGDGSANAGVNNGQIDVENNKDR